MTDASADPLSPAHPDGAPADPTDPATGSTASAVPPVVPSVDLDAIERDLTGVDVALSRLADGTYWSDEVTGEPIPEHVLVRNPIARRA